MIDLRTGIPGSGKTLSALEALAKRIARFEAHPEESRPIFVHNVTDLALPHSPMPTKTYQPDTRKPGILVPDWDAIPDGAYVLIDEAQCFFPPRGSTSEPPPHVAWLNTHRHHGIDLTVITQHPKLIDGSLRALVGKHQHYRRLFGGARAVCYEWDACSDNLQGTANAVTSYFSFPKKAFEYYKSAEIHTKQSFKLPKWLMIPVIGVVLSVFAFPRAYSTITNATSGKGLSAAAPSASAAVAKLVALPASAPDAPAPRPLAVVAEVAPPRVAGCVASVRACLCVYENGLTAPISQEVCRATSTLLGGLVSYDVSPPDQPRASKAASAIRKVAQEPPNSVTVINGALPVPTGLSKIGT